MTETRQAMTRREFETALDRWGADLTRWPSDEARRARAYLGGAADARVMLQAAERLDTFLDTLQRHEPPAGLAARIAARTPARGTAERLLAWFSGPLWRPVAVALTLMVGGFLAGTMTTSALDSELTDAVVNLALTDLYSELDDVQP